MACNFVSARFSLGEMILDEALVGASMRDPTDAKPSVGIEVCISDVRRLSVLSRRTPRLAWRCRNELLRMTRCLLCLLGFDSSFQYLQP